MEEKLYPIDLPAGFQNSGTVYQSKGRWRAGNLVRFFQGNKQPVGGWVERALTGATMTGTPNAAISWQLSNGHSYLAIGTTLGLYVIDSSNVVTSITPAAMDSTPWTWQLELFGSYLMAITNRTGFIDDALSNVYLWAGVVGTPAIAAYTAGNGPGSVYGCVVTPERFFVALRGATPLPASGTGGWIVRPPIAGALPVV